MNLSDKFDLYIHGKNQEFNMRDILSKIPDNDKIALEVLHDLKNYKTKIVVDEEIKGNYYIFLNDSIYISSKLNKDDSYKRLTVICHEVIHSIQSKVLQWINFILSNLEFILFFLILILCKTFKLNYNIKNIYYIIVVLSIFIRAALETHACVGSISLSEKYIAKYISLEASKFAKKILKVQIICGLPIMLISLFFW